MRIFNTSGPCNPEKHYTVMREALIDKGQALVDQGRYFTIFAPRQAGKTTYFRLLFRRLQAIGYTPIGISFESLKTISRHKFYATVAYLIQRKLVEQNIQVAIQMEDQVDFQRFFDQLRTQTPNVVLIIDEFEDIPEAVLSELMHAFRALYQDKQHHALHSLSLVGVSTLAELVVSAASPFNVVDELRIPYFTFAEVEELIGQYVAETGQPFTTEVVQAIYANTQGQPGLVCALCEYLVTEMVPDRRQAITMVVFYPTLKYFLTERFDKNIINIVQKAREKPDFVLQLLFNENPIPFTVNNPDIAYLYANGVIDNVDGNVDIPVPLYSKSLITAFRPLLNGESKHYVAVHDTFQEYATAQRLNLQAILNKYREYVQRRGFHAFDTEQLKEGAWHYSLDGFINFFIERLGGVTFVETPSGRGRTDIFILYHQHKYIIETKIFTDQAYFQNGKAQLADYLRTEGVSEGYYVVFSNKHTDADILYFDETIAGKRIYTYIILTNFERPGGRGSKEL
ncbi:MAG: ATP-binding protein [Caldilineaceae bacterium]